MMNSTPVPTVSVCVTTYNQDQYIGDCLVSVLAQLPDVSLEVLVGDDGTGSETPAIVSRIAALHPGVISYYKHEKNLGASKNYQFLVARARGTYIAHLDGDDFWLPGKLAVQVKWLEEYPASIACYTNAIVVDENGIATGVFSSRVDKPIDLEFILARGNFLNHSSLVYRSSHRNLVLDISESFIDYQLHLAFARHGVLGFSNRALCVYRCGTAHSMAKTMSAAVRDLYLQAIYSVLQDEAMGATVRRRVLRHFWRALLVNGAGQRDFRALWRWASKFRSDHPQYYASVVLSGVLSLLGELPWVLARKLRRFLLPRHRLKVMHER